MTRIKITLFGQQGKEGESYCADWDEVSRFYDDNVAGTGLTMICETEGSKHEGET